MPASKEVYHPLNGKEIREVLIKRTTDRINKLPMMKEGHAYHEAVLAFSFTMTATPADCPVPTMDFEEVVAAQGYKLEPDYIKVVDTIQTLEGKKKELEAQIVKLESGIEKIDRLLEIAIEVQEAEEVISAGKIPDQVRIDNELPLPRIVTQTSPMGVTTQSEKLIDYDKL